MNTDTVTERLRMLMPQTPLRELQNTNNNTNNDNNTDGDHDNYDDTADVHPLPDPNVTLNESLSNG